MYTLHYPPENGKGRMLITPLIPSGEYGGFDESQRTSRSGGKAEVVSYLKKREGYSRLVMIGDGVTDMEACPPADAFIGEILCLSIYFRIRNG